MAVYRNIATRLFMAGAVFSNAYSPRQLWNVSYFIRADMGVTGSAVSSWADQSVAGAAAMAQGSGLKQPAATASVFGGARPSVKFDGTGDGMIGPAGSACITNSEGTIYVLWRPSAFINDSATLYSNDAIVGDTGGASYGIFGRNNTPRFYAYNYDGTQDISATTAAAVDTTYVLRWRHSGGNVYLRVNDDAESTGVASGNTAALAGGISIGHGWDGTKYAAGDMGALVCAKVALSTTEDRVINWFLKSYGGLT